jgi:hypothetical protein
MNNNILKYNIMNDNLNFLSKQMIKYLCLFIIILVIISGLSLKKLKLFCLGCSKGSWWYECIEGTGYGSTQCDIYKMTYNSIATVINKLHIVKEKIDVVINHFMYVFNKIWNLVNTAGNAIKKELYLPHMSLPRVPLPNISCHVPLLGNLCGPIQSAVHGIIRGLNGTGSFVSILFNQILAIFNKIIEFLKTIVDQFLKLFSKIFSSIVKPLKHTYKLILNLKNEIIGLYDRFINLGLFNILIYGVITTLETILPMQLVSVMGSAMLVIALIFGLPIIGITYILFKVTFFILLLPFNIFKFIFTQIFNLVRTAF